MGGYYTKDSTEFVYDYGVDKDKEAEGKKQFIAKQVEREQASIKTSSIDKFVGRYVAWSTREIKDRTELLDDINEYIESVGDFPPIHSKQMLKSAVYKCGIKKGVSSKINRFNFYDLLN